MNADSYVRALLRSIACRFSRGVRDTRGATSTEYIIIVAFVALASVSAFLFLGKAVDHDFTTARAYVLYPVP